MSEYSIPDVIMLALGRKYGEAALSEHRRMYQEIIDDNVIDISLGFIDHIIDFIIVEVGTEAAMTYRANLVDALSKARLNRPEMKAN